MYPTTYVVRRAPSAAGRCRPVLSHPHRGMHYGPPAHFFGPLAARAPFHPFFHGGRSNRDVFDHFDDFVNRSFEGFFPSTADRRTRGPADFVWQPRFDAREVDGAYQLRGELPGVDAKDLEVEFTNANTLVIRGRTETERSEGAAPAQQAEKAIQQDGEDVSMSSAENAANAQEADKANDDAASVHSESSYVQPTVEDEADATRRESVGTETTADAPKIDTPNTEAEQTVAKRAEQQAEPQQPRYWVSERSTGSFSRSFEFPGRVDADGVTASLKNGILDVVVPKAKAPEAKKINVQ